MSALGLENNALLIVWSSALAEAESLSTIRSAIFGSSSIANVKVFSVSACGFSGNGGVFVLVVVVVVVVVVVLFLFIRFKGLDEEEEELPIR